MEEKIMINDILLGVKNNLITYQNAIAECDNIQLRQTLQQIRNIDECLQYEIFKTAQNKGYYKTSQEATANEVDTLRNDV